MLLKFYPGVGRALVKKVNEGCLHSCSGLVREQAKAEQSDQSGIMLLPWRVSIRR